MKFTLCLTQRCNLSCSYCYIGKKNAVMSLETARQIIDFAFNVTPMDEKVDIGFFGGEPLLHFGLIKEITALIENHPHFDTQRAELSVVTNGTIFSDEIARFLNEHHIVFCLSCDGPPHVQDTMRRFQDGTGSSSLVEGTIKSALVTLPVVLVNAVYHPSTFRHLPEVIEYLSSLGLRQIYLNPDFSASWSKGEADLLPEVYGKIGGQYVDYYLDGRPHFISLVDAKIAVILRGGYDPHERCRMGAGEFAFAPSGNVYPCERLIGFDEGRIHCLGNIESGFGWEGLCTKSATTRVENTECQACGLNNYCMNWCGCSNYFSSGRYNKVGPFLCASEKAAISTSFHVFQTLEREMGACFFDHLAGRPTINARPR